MKHLLKELVFLSILMSVFASSKATTAYPYPIEYSQPDGTKLTLTLQGDEYLSWAVSEDNYTLIRNQAGAFVYATVDTQGNLVPSGFIANDIHKRSAEDKIFLLGMPKNLRFSKSQVATVNSVRQIYEYERNNALLGTKGAKTTRNIILLLAAFADVSFTKTKADFENLMNQVGYNVNGAVGSFKDFYYENSYGALTFQTTVAGPYTASQNMAYYGADVGNNHSPNASALISEVVALSDVDVDYSNFDYDSDGKVDALYVIFAAYGQESGASTDAIWSHAGGFTTQTLDGKTLSKYACSPELSGNQGTNITAIGVICHEFGHTLGAPDFYDTNYATNGSYPGTGKWDIMAGGTWNNRGKSPAHHNAWTKSYRYNWTSVTTINGGADITMANAEQNSNAFYRINTSTPNEYFLLENRQQISFDGALPGHGLIIYHVDANYIATAGNAINAGIHQGLYPEAANHIASNGIGEDAQYINSAGCPFPGSSNKTSFTNTTTPNAKSWADANSDFPITMISELSGVVSFAVAGGLGDNPTNFTATAISGSQIDLTWTRSSLRDVVLAYSTSPAFGVPQNGTTYSAGNSIAGGGTVLYAGANETFAHINLHGTTTYYYKIWTVENATPTYSSGYVAIATTPCGLTVLPITAGFENATVPPQCWASFKGANGLGVNNWLAFPNSAYAHTGTYSASVMYETSDGNQKEAWLVTPRIELPVNTVALEFWERKVNTENLGSTFNIKVSTTSQTDIASFTTVATYNEPSISTTYSKRTVNLSNYAGQNIYVAFMVSRDGGDYWFVDDIAIQTMTLPPTAITDAATNISGMGATFNGVVNASNLNTTVTFEYGTTIGYGSSIAATPNVVNGLSNTNVSTNISDLYGNTTYHYRVKAENANGISYGSDATFTTLCGLTALPLSTSFETGTVPPQCWASFRDAGNLGTKDWMRFPNSEYAHTGTYSACVQYENPSPATQDWLVTPLMQLPVNNTITFEYWERKINAAIYGGSFFIKVSTTSQTNIESFTTITSYTEANINTSYTKRSIDLSTYSGQNVYIAIMTARSSSGDYWFVDDVSLTAVPLPTYTVTYNGNTNTGGTAPVDANAYVQGATVTVANKGNLAKNGYSFALWNTAADGSGTSFAENATFVMPASNRTLYAQWTQTAPTASTATNISATKFTANWNVVTDAIEYRVDVSTNIGFSSYVTNYQDATAGTNVSLQVSNLLPNTQYHYRVRAVVSGVTSDNSNIITVNTAARTWTGTAWEGGAPNITQNALIAGNYTQNAGFECNNLTINTGATLYVNPLYTAKANGNITNNGTIWLKSDLTTNPSGALINYGTISESGAYIAERNICQKTVAHYVSAPMPNQLNTVFGAYTSFKRYNSNYLWTNFTGTLEVMRGYSTMYGLANKVVTFSGAPFNTGNLSWNTWKGANVVGNPYPSAVDWNAASGWTKTNIATSISFFSGTRYAVWNGTSGTNGATSIIPAMQAFMINSTSAGSLAVNNNARVASNQAFWKVNNVVDNGLRLKVTGGNFDGDETIIKFNADATENFDAEFDGYKLFEEEAGMAHLFTQTSASEALAINYLPEVETMPLYFVCGVSGSYTISATEINLTGNQTVVLQDNKTGTFTDLTTNNYQFNYITSDSPNRFLLHFAKPTSANGVLSEKINIYSNQNTVYVNIGNQTQAQVEIYDLNGRKVVSETMKSSSATFMLQPQGAYLVKVMSDGKVETKRVFIQR